MSDSDGNSSTTTITSPLVTGIPYDRFLDCVHCGLCTSACPTYLETGDENDSPRGRIYLMRGVTDGRLELSDSVRGHLDLCLDCRSCESACPSGVQYGRLIEPFRVAMHASPDAKASAQSASWLERTLLQKVFPHASRVKWSLWPARWMQRLKLDLVFQRAGLTRLLPQFLQRMHRLLPNLATKSPPFPSVLPAIGPRRARVGLFTGCVADAMFGPTNWATARVLQHNGCEVVIPRSQVCCGAIHYHSGSAEPALAFARRNADAFLPEELDAVIINVAGCGSMLKDYGHVAKENGTGVSVVAESLERFSHKVKDISEFLVELGPIRPTGELKLKATYHDACHLCHAQKIREQPRTLLQMIPGLELVPLAESEICCGAAGSYNLTEPEMADRLGQRKLRNLIATGAEVVVMGNAGCSLQIQAMIRESGHTLRVMHPMDLLDLSYRHLPLHSRSK